MSFEDPSHLSYCNILIFYYFQLTHGAICIHLQKFSVLLVELHEIPISPRLQPVQVPLDGSTPHFFCITFRLVEDTLCPVIHIINEDVEQNWSQYLPLKYTASYCPLSRPTTTDHHPLGLAIQSAFSPSLFPYLVHISSALLRGS